MAGKIDAYLDCVSPYSYFAFLHLKRNRALLKEHNVTVEFIPVFLGGINHGSGNKPPWTLDAKAKYSSFDSGRAKKYFNAPNVKSPDVFPIVSLLPQRSLVYIKEKFPQEKYEDIFHEFWIALWESNMDISKPEVLLEVLRRHLSATEAQKAVEAAGSKEYKQMLNDNTGDALKKGAFGAPWSWVTNKEGKGEPFFGSDRFHFMWEYLGIPWRDIEILLKSKM